ncbi:Tetratricopeptide repeat-containing protein [Arenibacter nanhaiticus]|uniref:Tetratricopeptide repeat-containing protein n=1 Tax=Arenibacter nanhaiticus TaxID=558155 RepID=A0A1M6IN87_9FLAO|nr:tetratricopeptide repeat protein [Arenibacter nanhaiticus]SHJ35931.1 Tetratricopeptide repeat-containing protein [Arenibacter nanhaiticus]
MIVFFAKGNAQSVSMAVPDSLYATGNYTLAINEYAKKGSLNAQLQIARAYNAMGNYDKALLQYESLVQNNESLELATYELGRLYLKLKKYEKSKELFNQLIEKNKLNPEFYYYLGESLKALERFPESIIAYKNSIKIDSTHLRSLFQLGKYYVLQRERDSVVKYVDQGLRFYADDVSLINLKALAYYNDHLLWWAIPLFERLVKLGEDKEYIHEKMGLAYLSTGKFKESKESYFKLLQFDEDNPKALYGLGTAYWKLQERDSAKAYIKKSIEVQKVVLDKEYNALARLAMEQNDLKLAIKYYKKAYQEDPTAYLYKYEECLLTDQYYKDPKMSLQCYKAYQEKFGSQNDYFSEFVAKRLSEIKEEIHMKTY